MSQEGHTTIIGAAYFSPVKLSGSKRPYMHIDVVYEGKAKDGGDIGIGLILCGEQAYKVAEHVGIALRGHVILAGQISTRTFKQRGKDCARSGVEVLQFGVSPLSGEETLFIDGIDFLMLR